jgi:adenylate kinase
MHLRTFIFIGASGSGKGTQVKLLKEKLSARTPETPIFYLQTGQYFRDFVKSENYAAHIARHANETGERQPDFLAMWIWSDVFVKSLKGNEHIIIDGSPRSLNEAQNLDIAMKFFSRTQPTVIYLNVPRRWSREHLLERAKKENRKDDTPESIEKRLGWFDRDVLPAINYYRRDRDYDFIEIDGTRSVEEVHSDIIARIFSKSE